MVQGLGFFVFFRCRIYKSLGFNVQSFWFVGVLNGFQGLQHLSFLRVECVGFLMALGLEFQVKDFTQFLQGLGLWIFWVKVFYVFIGLGFFCIFRVQHIPFRALLCLEFKVFQVQGFLRVQYLLGFLRVQGLRFFFVLFGIGFTFFLFRVQRLGFCRSFNGVQGLFQG